MPKLDSLFFPSRHGTKQILYWSLLIRATFLTWGSVLLLCMAGVLVLQGNWFQYLQWKTKVLHPTCITWGSGPLLHMARVLIPSGKLLMLMLTFILLVEYYTLKQSTEFVII